MLKTLANSLVIKRLAVVALIVVMSLGVTGATTITGNATSADAQSLDDARPSIFVSTDIELQTPVTDAGHDLLHDDSVPASPVDRTRDQMTTDPASAAAAQLAALVNQKHGGPRVIEMEVTAYCACKKCCGPKAQGITASGKRVNYNNGLFVAADKALPFGTKLIIPGYASNRPVEVIDRGGAIKGTKLDVYFPSHETAKKWGRQKLLVTIVE